MSWDTLFQLPGLITQLIIALITLGFVLIFIAAPFFWAWSEIEHYRKIKDTETSYWDGWWSRLWEYVQIMLALIVAYGFYNWMSWRVEQGLPAFPGA